jgi:hypothetical protein
MRLAIVNHHGRTPAGAESAMLLFIDHLPRDIESTFFLFEEGEFADHLRQCGNDVAVLPMSNRIKPSTRTHLVSDVLVDSIGLAWRLALSFRAAKADVVSRIR